MKRPIAHVVKNRKTFNMEQGFLKVHLSVKNDNFMVYSVRIMIEPLISAQMSTFDRLKGIKSMKKAPK